MPYRTISMALDYDGYIIRPPLESRSLILQVTVGCSHNRCRFCPAFKSKRFRLKDSDVVLRDIQTASAIPFPCVFLADGDALIMPVERLLEILVRLREAGLGSERVSTYANIKSISRRQDQDLLRLKQAGLTRLYVGLESGSEAVLRRMDKGVTAAQVAEHASRALRLGFEVSMTMMLGLGGTELSDEHVRGTVDLLNAVQPDHVRLLTLMVVPGTPLADDLEAGAFHPISPMKSLEELRDIIKGIQFETKLYANHISNYFPLKGRLPEGREALVQALNEVIDSGDVSRLTPEEHRGL